MAKIGIIVGSTTGNTETVGNTIAGLLTDKGHTVENCDVASIAPADLPQDFDAVLFGCSTWGEDEIELQDDFQDFYDNMDSANLSGKKVAVFGCGDSSYTYFCGAVDAIEEKSKELGAVIIADGLKLDVEEDEQDIADFADMVHEKLSA